MIITLSGPPGSGTTTVGKKLARKLKIQYLAVGEIFRRMAKEKKMTLEEFSKLAETNPDFDKEIDLRQTREASKKDIVLDSRLSGWLIKSANLKVFLKAPLETRIARVAKRDKISEDESFIEVKMREESEKKRYREYYDINIDDLRIYDLVIDTLKWNADEVASIILKAVKR